MAKAHTIILLLAATAAFAAAHPGLGKGGIINIGSIMGGGDGNGTAAHGHAAKVISGPTITVTQDGATEAGGKGSSCKCTTDCQDVEKKVCREAEVEKEVCKDEDEKVEEVVCIQRCFKADKVISIGKGRRLLTVDTINTIPHMVHGIAKGVIVGGGNSTNTTESDSGNATATATPLAINIPHFGKGAGVGGSGSDGGARQQQEVCRDVCKPEQRTVTRKVCKMVKNMERVDCRVVSVEPVCAKSCECGFIGGKGHSG